MLSETSQIKGLTLITSYLLTSNEHLTVCHPQSKAVTMPALTDLNIAVVGTGANGAGIGADLVNAGLRVTWIEQWPDNVAAIRENGVRIEFGQLDEGGRVETAHPRIINLCEVATLREKFDAVLLLVKAYDTRWACELIKPYVADDGFVIGVQNGMSVDDIVAVMGEERSLGAVLEITAAMYTPGVVERHSDRDRSWFAVGAPSSAGTQHVASAAAILRTVGVVEETTDIRSAKWMKLALNASELVPSAIMDLSIADAAKTEGLYDVMLAAGNEAVEAALADGCQVRPIFGMEGDVASSPETFVETVLAELIANYILSYSRSTILQDWMKNRHSEVNELNGFVVQVLASAGKSAPANQAVVEFAAEIELGTRKRGIHNLEPLTARVRELGGLVG